MKTRSRIALQRLGTMMVGILVALLLAECALRLVGFEFTLYPSKVQFGWPDPVTINQMYRPDPDLLWIPKDYAAGLKSVVDTHPSLVLMGCSCTQFGKYDKFLAEAILANRPKSSFTFVNLGVGGWSSHQGLRQLERDVVPMKPRVVTIYYGWNDHWCTFGLSDKEIGRFNLQHRLLTMLSSKSRVAQLINTVCFSGTSKGVTAQQRVSIDDFRYNLTQMVRIAKEHSIVPVLLTAPTSHRVGKEPVYLAYRWLEKLSDLVPLHRAYVNAVRDVALENDVHLVDLYGLFSKLSEVDLSASFTADGIHLTEQGDRRIAQYLYEHFDRTGLLNEMMAGMDVPRQGVSRPAEQLGGTLRR